MAVSLRALTLIASTLLGAGAVLVWQYFSARAGGAEPGFREAALVCNRANVSKIRINPETGRVQLCH